MKKVLWIPLSMMTISLMLSGCGSTGNSQTGTSAPSPETAAEESSESVEMKLPDQGGSESGAASGLNTPGAGSSQRIQASNFEMELKINPDDTKDIIDKLKQFTAEKGGYILSLETSLYELDEEDPEEDSTGSGKEEGIETSEAKETAAYDEYDDNYDNYYDDDYDDYYSYYNPNWTSMTIVLPSSQSDALVKQLSSDYEVLNQSETLTDYTAEYRCLIDKQTALEDEEKRLISLMEDTRASGQYRSADSDSDFLETVIQLENNLWQTRRDLNECRFGNAVSYYYGGGQGLYDFEEMRGMSAINLEIYVEPKK